MTAQTRNEFKTKTSLSFLFEDDEFDISEEGSSRLDKISNELYLRCQELQIMLYDKENINPIKESQCERQIEKLIKDIESINEKDKEHLKLKAKDAVTKLANKAAYAKIKKLKENSADPNEVREEKVKFNILIEIIKDSFNISSRKSFKKSPSAQTPFDVNLISSSPNKSEKKSILKSTNKSPVASTRAKAKHAVYFGQSEIKTCREHKKITLKSPQATMAELPSGPIDRMQMEPFKIKKPIRRAGIKTPSSHTNTIVTRQFYPEDEGGGVPTLARK
ncbi:MAG TPA: hypothetical protein VHE99_01860 [Gammaproteobacteria bacterium]|nr:hypothetical protein [Gammaproteobacteria bacterium]